MTAACLGIDPKLWTDADSRSRKGNTSAVRVCAGCPIRLDCAATAEHLRTQPFSGSKYEPLIQWRPHGIWAGMLYDGTTRAPVRPPVLGPQSSVAAAPCRGVGRKEAVPGGLGEAMSGTAPAS